MIGIGIEWSYFQGLLLAVLIEATDPPQGPCKIKSLSSMIIVVEG